MARHNPFIALVVSFLLALLLTMLPLPETLAPWRPEFVTMALIFWVLNTPNLVGIWVAFFIGLLLDVLFATPFGVHALVLVVLAYLARLAHRWVAVLSTWQTSALVFGLVLLGLFIKIVLLKFVAHAPDSPLYWLPALTSAVVWSPLMVAMRRFTPL